jgi:hypothetical protein
MRNSIQQGPGRSTPKQITHPKKVVQGRVSLYSATGWDDAYLEALYTRLSAIVHRLVQVVV